MPMKRLLLALLLTVAAGCTTVPKETVAIDRFVDDVLTGVPEVPSLGIAVVRDGRVVYLREPQTPYYIGSTTKAYTGLACAILANRGQIDLDAPVSKYLPEVTMPNAPTLRAFLTHSSGIANNGIVMRTAYTGEHTATQLATMLNSSRPIKPGFTYDNLGYVVASLVIERVTGKPWQKALDDLVFRPLGMHHTTAYMSVAEKWGMPLPYQPNGKGEMAVVQLRKNDQMMHAAGGIVTTPSDLAKWLNANILREGGNIPRAAFDEALKMQVPAVIERGEFKTNGYGFGWYQASYKGENALYHGGGFPGWQSSFSMLPDKKIGVGVMTNSSGPSAQVLLAITSYIDDVLLGATADPATKAGEIKAQIAKMRTAMAADLEKRAKRPWMLKHPNDAYTGRYENPLVGPFVIAREGDHLVATLANLRAVLEPYPEAESARVEMVPGSGEVLRFTFTNGEKPDSLTWGDDIFVRVQ